MGSETVNKLLTVLTGKTVARLCSPCLGTSLSQFTSLPTIFFKFAVQSNNLQVCLFLTLPCPWAQSWVPLISLQWWRLGDRGWGLLAPMERDTVKGHPRSAVPSLLGGWSGRFSCYSGWKGVTFKPSLYPCLRSVFTFITKRWHIYHVCRLIKETPDPRKFQASRILETVFQDRLNNASPVKCASRDPTFVFPPALPTLNRFPWEMVVFDAGEF